MIHFEFVYVPEILYNFTPTQNRFHGGTLVNSKWIIDVYIPFDGKFDADFEFEVSENLFLTTHFREKRV